MHQQLSLYASVPDADLKITLHTLAALSGAHPRGVSQHCLVWSTAYPFKPILKAGEVNQVEQYRITMVNEEELVDREQTKVKHKVVSYRDDPETLRARIWDLKISEMPEAGKRKVTSQSQIKGSISEGDPFEFMQKLGYKFDYEYWIRGYKFVFGSIVLNLFRICTLGSSEGEEADQPIDVDNTDQKKLVLVDASGRWTVQSHINVQLLTDMDAMSSATAQLERLQTDLAGLFELQMPDRNSLDTRLRRTA